MNNLAFPNAAGLQTQLHVVKQTADLSSMELRVIDDMINLLEVVKRIDSYTTAPMPNPSPTLKGFPEENTYEKHRKMFEARRRIE